MRSGMGNTRSRRTVAPVSRASAATRGTTASLRSSALIGARIRLVMSFLLCPFGRGADRRRFPGNETWGRLNRIAARVHQIRMDRSEEGGEGAMRRFLMFVLMLLFMALGALEVVASRAVPLP